MTSRNKFCIKTVFAKFRYELKISSLLIYFLFGLLINLSSQVVPLPCQTAADATFDLDRKNWNNGSTSVHSEGSMHNFALPAQSMFGPCKKITNIQVELSNMMIDQTNMPADCPDINLSNGCYINIYTNCPSFMPASCAESNLIDQFPGPFVDHSLSYDCPPHDLPWDGVFSFDVVPVAQTGCSTGQSMLSSGSVVLSYDLCVTITISDLAIETFVDLGSDETLCPDVDIMLDAGTYDQYDWSPNGETSQMISTSGPGIYEVTVTDENGCTDIDDVMISEHPDPTVSFDPVMPAVCDGGMIAVSVNESYSMYQWDTGQNGQTVSLPTGIHEVTVTDNNNCTGTNTVEVISVPPPNAGNDGSIDVCSDLNNYDIEALLGAHDAGGTWMDVNATGVDLNANATSVSFSLLTAGVYQYTYTVTGNSPCMDDIATISVTVFEEPNAGQDNTLNVCNDGSSYDMDNLLGIHDAGGSWSDDDGSGVNINVSPMFTSFGGVSGGVYDYTYTVPGSAVCLPDVATITVTVFEQGDAGTSNQVQYCINPGFLDFYDLISTLDFSGTWSDDDGTALVINPDPSNVDISSLPSGTYDFSYTISANAACIGDFATLTIQLDDTVEAGANNQATVCEGTDIDLVTLLDASATSGGTFFDSDGTGTLTGSVFNTTGLAGSSYDFEYNVGMVGGPCGSDNAFFEIFVETSVSAGMNVDESFCSFATINLYDLLQNEDQGGMFDDLSGSGGLSGNILDPSSFTPGTYMYRYTIGDDVTCPSSNADITLTFLPEAIFQLDTFICDVDTFDFQGIVLDKESPTYRDTIVGAACDSIISVNVDFEDTDTTLFDPILCIGDSIMIDTIWYDAANTSDEFLFTSVGSCDSLVIIDVSFYPPADSIISLDLCFGDSIVVNGTTYDGANSMGMEILPGESQNGCDSIVNIDLRFDSGVMIIRDDVLCNMDSIVVAGVTYNTSNPTGQEILLGSSCDTTVTIDLSFLPISTGSLDGDFCDGFSIEINGNTYNISNPTGEEVLENANIDGCDSTVTIDLNILPEVSFDLQTTLCNNDSIVVNGNVYNMANPIGTEVLPLASQGGCDSIVNIDLNFTGAAQFTLDPTLCIGDSVTVNGTTYDNVNPIGTEILPLASQGGCDSIVDINLSFYPESTFDFTTVLCENDSITVNGTIYNQDNTSGTEILEGMSSQGCDSTILVDITISDAFLFEDQVSICNGDSIFLEGLWQFTAGEYLDTLQTTELCDSIISTMLSVEPCLIDVETQVSNNLCFGAMSGSILLTLTSTVDLPFTVMWDGQAQGQSGSEQITSIVSTYSITDLVSDNYDVTIIDVAGMELYRSTQTVIDENAAISGNWSISDSIQCFNDFANIEFQASGGLPPYTFQWTPSGLGISSSISDVAAGEYFVTVTDQNSCSFDTSYILVEPAELLIEVDFTDITCGGLDDGRIEILSISGGTAPYESLLNGMEFLFTSETLPEGQYEVTVLDANNCMASISEELLPASEIELVSYIQSYTLKSNENILLEGDTLVSNLNLTWIDPTNTLSCTDCANPTANPTTSTIYELVATDDSGCSQLVLVTVNVSTVETVFPNVFSPNGDAANDEMVFKIFDSSIQSFQVSIFDRWGNKVYSGISIDNILTWNGQYNGSILSSGVYVYTITTIDNLGNTESKLGEVCLIR